MTHPCDGCKCRSAGSPVAPVSRREGQIALVFDSPTGYESIGRSVFQGGTGEILDATVRAVIRASGETPPQNLLEEVAVLHAVAKATPGNKAPQIKEWRGCRERLLVDLAEVKPRAVLSLGAAACASLSGTDKATPITKWRGLMRYLDLPDGSTVPWVATIAPGSVAGKNEYYRDLSSDVWKIWTQGEPVAEPDVDIHIPRTYEALCDDLALLEGASIVTCDIETAPRDSDDFTTSLKGWTGRILSVGFGADYGDNAGIAVIVPLELLEDPRVQDLCWERVYRKSTRTIGQNFKFDLQFLMRWWGETSVPTDALLGDTLLLGSLLDERPAKDRIGGLGLKEQASFRYDYPDYGWNWSEFYRDLAHDGYFGWSCEKLPLDSKGKMMACPHPHPAEGKVADLEGMYVYQAKDVYFTAKWWFDLVAEAEAESPNLMKAHDAVMVPAMKTLAACELRGAPLDLVWLRGYAAYLRGRIERRQRALEANVVDVQIGSPKQIADLMYDVWGMTPDMRKMKFKDGALVDDRSTDKEHIEAAVKKYWDDPELSRAARWLRTLLRWRTDTKQLSTYSETIIAMADENDRIHAQFKLHGTITGRLSAERPNMQNIPAVDKREEVDGRLVYTLRGAKKTYRPARRGFAPSNGYLWVEADYSQLELRVAAWLSGDDKLRDVFTAGRDIHLEVASTMFSKPPEQISKPERYLAKAVDFGILYGRQGKALAAGAEMDYYENELGGKRWDEETADAFIRKFLRGYPKLGEWLEDNGQHAIDHYYVETPFGRRRRFPFRPRTKYEKMRIQRQANNTPIQSAASDLCIQAMARLEPLLPDGAALLFPVHDSICMEVREDLIEDVRTIAKDQMEILLPGGVPLTIDFEYGSSWADTH